MPHEAAAACTETASAAQSVDAAMGHSNGQTAGFRMATAENFRLRTERGTTGEQVAAMPRQLQVKQDAIQKAETIRDSSQTQLGIMMLHVLQRSHSLAAARPEQVCTEAHATDSTKQLQQAEDALVKRRDEPATGLRYLQENLSHTEAKSLEAKLPREVSAVAGHQFAQLDCQLSLERQVADMQNQLQQVQNQKNQLEEAASFHAAEMRGQIDSLQREVAQTKIARGLNADSSTGALAVPGVLYLKLRALRQLSPCWQKCHSRSTVILSGGSATSRNSGKRDADMALNMNAYAVVCVKYVRD